MTQTSETRTHETMDGEVFQIERIAGGLQQVTRNSDWNGRGVICTVSDESVALAAYAAAIEQAERRS